MIATRERLALGLVAVALLAVAAAVAWRQPRSGGADAAATRGPALEVSRPAPGPSPLLVDRLGRRPHAPEPEVDVFGARAWFTSPPEVPSAPVRAIVPPPPPAALGQPSLPFQYMGRLLSGDERMLFLAAGDRNLVLREGEVADALYRLDRVDEIGATFTHLELGVQLYLSFLGEPGGAGREQPRPAVDGVIMRGEANRPTATGRESEQSDGIQGPAAAPRDGGPDLTGKPPSGSDARRARAVLAIQREPWVCTAQQATQLRDCDASADRDCKQAVAARYRACLGSSLRSALPSPAPDEE